ncbi:DUF1918 domain-containing protein [Streptomyces mirabilis]
MRAHLGDQLVIEGPTTGAARRDGEIVGLHHEDGTPPTTCAGRTRTR